MVGFVSAAEYCDGQLYLEILLGIESEITMASVDSYKPVFSISESSSPISRVISGNISVSFAGSDRQVLWGFLNRTEPWLIQSMGVLQKYFAWEDSTLVIARRNLVYEDVTFSGKEFAKQYALETGIPENKIQSIPMIVSTVKVTTDSGEVYYFETPLNIQSRVPIMINGVGLEFEGEFILKAIQDKLVINHYLLLEDYVTGVVPNEIGSDAPMEALKAQAVAARTHAISLLINNRHLLDGYDLCNGTHCQVYKGKYLCNYNILKAVNETKDEVLTYDGVVADANYHSACGGKTESSANVWKGTPVPHLSGVTCIDNTADFDLSNEAEARRWIDTSVSYQGTSSWEKAAISWNTSISRQALARNLGMDYVNRVVINKRGNSGRIIDMSFQGTGSVRLTSEYKIRQVFGSAKSSFFYINGRYSAAQESVASMYLSEIINLRGKGSGHGVGMCQVGALRRARSGDFYSDILQHYYPGTIIANNWIPHDQ